MGLEEEGQRKAISMSHQLFLQEYLEEALIYAGR